MADLWTLRAYDVQTGERLVEVAYEEPINALTADPEQLVVGRRHGLAGLSPDGSERWTFSSDDLDRSGGGIALGDGVAYAAFDAPDGGALVAVDTTDGTERWRSDVNPDMSPRPPAPAVANGVVYTPARFERLVAVDAADGHVRWSFEDESDAPGQWSPVAIDGETLYAARGDAVYALEDP